MAEERTNPLIELSKKIIPNHVIISYFMHETSREQLEEEIESRSADFEDDIARTGMSPKLLSRLLSTLVELSCEEVWKEHNL